MKRNFFLILTLLSCSFFNVLKSQTTTDLGFKGGLSIPSLTAGGSDNPINTGYSSRTGPAFAFHAEFHLSKQFSIQPELQYCAEGGKKNGAQAFSVPDELKPMFPPGQVPQYLYADYNSTAKFNYLILPILAKYHFLSGKNWDIYAAAGPFVSMLINAENVTSGNSPIYLDPQHTQPVLPSQSFDRTEDIKDELHKFNTGVAGHVGVAYHFGKSQVFVEGGGNYGFISIQKDEVNGKNKTGAAVVMVGYAYNFFQK